VAPEPAAAGGSPAPAPAPGTEWYDRLPETLRNDPSVAKYAGKTLEEFVNSHRDLAKFVGVPADDIARLSALRQAGLDALLKLGAGDKPEVFKLTPPEGTPEHLATGENLEWFKELAVEARLLPAQAEKLYQRFVERNVELQKAADDMVVQATKTLKEKHGQAFDQLVKDAGRGADFLGLRDVLNEAGLGANPVVVEAMARVATLFKEGTNPAGALPAAGALSPAQAEGRAVELTHKALQAWTRGDRAEAERLSREALEIRQRAS
jgi:hypothetical protein